MSRTHAVVDGYYEARDDFDQAPVQATTIADHEGQPAKEEGDHGSGAENQVTGNPSAVLQMPLNARCGEQYDRRYAELSSRTARRCQLPPPSPHQSDFSPFDRRSLGRADGVWRSIAPERAGGRGFRCRNGHVSTPCRSATSSDRVDRSVRAGMIVFSFVGVN